MSGVATEARATRLRWLGGPWGLLAACTVLLALCLTSIGLGAGQFSFADLLHGDPRTWQLLWLSRVPRTLALLLAGMSLAVAGLLMQMLVRNRFVEPSTAGTIESATLGILVVTLVAPGAPVIAKMLTATGFGLAGSLLFLLLLRRVPLRSPFLVPLIGLILGGIIHAATTYVAVQFELLQSLHAWTTGDFSGVLRGRYELLWIGFALTCVAYIAADRFTLAGMGREFASNLGLNHARLTLIGLLIVSAISAVVVVTAGSIPFLGLIVPNAVSLIFGDNMRRAIPWVALLGGVFVLACDIVGRLLLYPYEIPIGTVVGVVGSALFLWLLLSRRRGHG